MNFLNEISHRFPDAISFAAGRPFEGFFDLEDIHRYLRRFVDHVLATSGGDATFARRTVMQYGRTKGIIHDLIARHLHIDEGIEIDSEAIVVTVGCQEGLYLTLRALRGSERDAVLAVQPCYVGLTGAAALADLPVLPVAESAQGIDLADLRQSIERARKAGLRPRACYLVADFANPSGASLSRRARETLLQAAVDYDLLIIEDNPYGMFGPDTERPPTLKALDPGGRVIYLGTFAKTGVPGARVGYVLADQRVTMLTGATESLADQLAKLKSMLTVNTSPVAQAVIGGKLLEHGCSLRAANAREIAVYRRNLRQVLEGLRVRFADRQPAVTWNTPGGGFFVVLTVPFEAGDSLLEQSARRQGVIWTPMHHFYGDGRPRRQIRLAFSALTPGQIDAGLDRLRDFVAAYSR